MNNADELAMNLATTTMLFKAAGIDDAITLAEALADAISRVSEGESKHRLEPEMIMQSIGQRLCAFASDVISVQSFEECLPHANQFVREISSLMGSGT